MDATERTILSQYGLTEADRLGGGMEASVYALDEQTVLKVYGHATSAAHLQTLQRFYDGLERTAVNFALPRIRTISIAQGRCATVEDRLAGQPMSSLLQQTGAVDSERLMANYLRAALALGRVRMAYPAARRRLYDAEQISGIAQGDWHQFLRRFVEMKLAEVVRYFLRDVPLLHDKLARLYAILDRPYTGDNCLIHGDYFPGNLLCDAAGEIVAVLDFGLFTMRGDWRYDLATGCAFFDMYDEFKLNARARLLQLAGQLVGAEQLGVLYRYILVFSLVGANAYSPTCSDGHYQWCVQNLNNEEYWAEIT